MFSDFELCCHVVAGGIFVCGGRDSFAFDFATKNLNLVVGFWAKVMPASYYDWLGPGFAIKAVFGTVSFELGVLGLI